MTAKRHISSAQAFKKSKNEFARVEKIQKRVAKKKLKREHVALEKRLSKYKEALVKVISEVDGRNLQVKVKKAVFSGTIVLMSGYVYHVKEDFKGKALFFWNEKEKIVELIK
jgi:hypothetical protein